MLVLQKVHDGEAVVVAQGRAAFHTVVGFHDEDAGAQISAFPGEFSPGRALLVQSELEPRTVDSFAVVIGNHQVHFALGSRFAIELEGGLDRRSGGQRVVGIGGREDSLDLRGDKFGGRCSFFELQPVKQDAIAGDDQKRDRILIRCESDGFALPLRIQLMMGAKRLRPGKLAS